MQPGKLQDLVLTPAKAPASAILKGVETTPSILQGVDANSPVPRLLRADTGSATSSASEAESAMMSMVQLLQTQLAEQSKQNARLHALMEEQAVELAKLRAEKSSPAEAPEETREASAESSGVSFEAARQRVRRLVKVRADGTCAVPQHVVDQWNKQGTSREQLIRVFMEQGCDKDPKPRPLLITP